MDITNRHKFLWTLKDVQGSLIDSFTIEMIDQMFSVWKQNYLDVHPILNNHNTIPNKQDRFVFASQRRQTHGN